MENYVADVEGVVDIIRGVQNAAATATKPGDGSVESQLTPRLLTVKVSSYIKKKIV